MSLVPNIRRDVPVENAVSGTCYRLRCPRCTMAMGILPQIGPRVDVALDCAHCHFRLRSEWGVWNALPPAREAYYERFVFEYQIVRREEGRGSPHSEYYLSLPYRDLSERNQAQWSIRARTFHHFEEKVLPELEAKHPSGMDVLDLGSGNGWLSYRMALRGHRPIAVDLLVNDTDGLRAAAHYASVLPTMFPRVRAEFDSLPFVDSQFDCAIFNASFHYSEDYERTLNEAMRCVRPGGYIVISDSPWYSRESSGRQMLEERRALFIDKYGFPSDGQASKEYLTDTILCTLERRCGVRWRVESPFYGVRWAMRPLLARLQSKREPSRFRLYVAEVTK